MPTQPHPDARIDPVLTDLSIAYYNNQYIWEQVFPVVQVEDKSAHYYVFDKSEWTRDEAQHRAPGGQSEGGDFPLSDDQYNCSEKAYHTKIPDESGDTIGRDIDLETAKVNFVTEKIFLKAERDIADKVLDAGNWDTTTTLDGTDQFSHDDSTPIEIVEDEKDEVESKTGQPVNTLIMGYDVYRILKHHPQLIGRLPSQTIQTVGLEVMRELFEVDRILIGGARYNNSQRGQDDNFVRIWDQKKLWLGHVAESPGAQIPSAGYTFVWPREGQLRGVRRWRDEDSHSDKIEAFQSDDKKVTGSDLGALIIDAIA